MRKRRRELGGGEREESGRGGEEGRGGEWKIACGNIWSFVERIL